MPANIFGQGACLNEDQASSLSDAGINIQELSPVVLEYKTRGLETFTTGHKAPILFTQALDDTTGGGNQSTWLRDYVDAIDATSAQLVEVATGGHAAFVTDSTLQSAIRTFIGSDTTTSNSVSASSEISVLRSSGQTYTVGSTSYPVMGELYVPTSLSSSSIDVLVVYHGTLPEGGNSTIRQASETAIGGFLNTNGLNIRDKIIFSVAYPQDHISSSRQYDLVGLEDEEFLFGDNLPYARAALLWVKNSLNGFMSSNGISKTIDDVYIFGHSQGGALVSKLNTLETTTGVIANAPGPIQFDQTCAAFPSNTSCAKIRAAVGPEDLERNPCKNKNSCGKSVEELLSEYPIYSPQRGLYKSWGDIIFPWDIDYEVRSNLKYSDTDDRWKVAKYAALYAYFEDDRVLYIEDDGYKICLYEANQNILAIAGPLDKTKWDQICCIELSEPFGLPTIEEIEKVCDHYALDYFLDEWEEYKENWGENLFEQSLNSCNTEGITTEEFLRRLEGAKKDICGTVQDPVERRCMSTKSSDRWKEARVAKSNFYIRGDCVIAKGECEDTVCVFLAHTDMPVADPTGTLTRKEWFEKYKDFFKGPWEDYFQKLYCIQTGKNKCLEPQRKRDLPNYQLVEIGSLGHYVEQPIPNYKLDGKYVCERDNLETLNEVSEMQEPKVLTQAEIDALDPPQV